MDGYAPGKFTFNIDQYQGDTAVASTTFANIPSTPQTHVTLNVGSDITTVSPMIVDENGDGATDFTLTPKLDGVVTLDTTAPSTTVSISGTLGKNNWYTSSVLVTLNATDTESGVHATYLSLDGGATSTSSGQVTATISTEGIHSVAYWSDDNAGNTEQPHVLNFKIDKTAPEAKLIFNSITQKLDIIGLDALSSPTVLTTATSSLVTDSAGHTLRLIFTQPKTKDRRIVLNTTSLVYDGVATSTASALKYKWNTSGANVYSLFAAYLQNKVTKIEAHYRPKKLQTVLMQSPVDLVDSEDDDTSDIRPIKTRLSGMVIPFLLTSQGNVVINY
jgi:hypothetical protein